MNRWGIILPLPGVPLLEHQSLVRRLPDLGYTDVWTAETAGTDAFTPLVLASQWSDGLRLGTAIVPVFTRGPGLLAMTAATVADSAPGRFVLGVGASSPTIVEKWNAIEHREPFGRTRDTLRFLRTAFTGKAVTEDYPTFSVQGFKLDRPPAVPPPVLLAALRPGMLRLAAAEADGAITNWVAPGDVPKIRAVIGTEPELVAPIFVCPTEDAAEARSVGRMLIGTYLNVPAYRKFQDWLGRSEALAAMHRSREAGEHWWRAGQAIPDAVIDELIVHGSPEECRARLASYHAAGLNTPLITLLPVAGGDPVKHVEALAPGRA
ncbi:LLM class F420-dependent oxidoreductase [Streptomyces lunaelactis]|uniref:LLM class F420-dependent oxidoreductase n=1 Tax=Streptomyces lunaelactis TaxID=1535768 RepID=A0A2R4T1V5_9ACTN|nr:LLM class F420-dependent oxidoreductase [Streptomyces lunaelactis]AVZ73092.1 LLM class F420-dependent oxidoreductase [Streptomyces lunaelactis]NUK01338.1 LLM class F420-dependent oxidoreductase [Streptomyces lunaelactis]NUK09196.1 LLM class F420-dependent oxidoreductase [Streptomyces lunaelactis]NUK15569.1 LLM class F420-dependent oxidoreductase [Streptomyces lunaelactis]NUK25098.1 LLM class F420-dependent oxidoreductase [Streptomyces lunaelactis]